MASALLCVCAHVKRLKDATRFKEACPKRTDYEAQELADMRKWLVGEGSGEVAWQ